jgi:integrase
MEQRTPVGVHRQRRKTLTDRMVAALPKKRKRYTKTDPELRGHYVRVMPQGANVYCVVARDPYGRQVWHTIGSADTFKIEEAREQGREAIKRIAAGKPPKEPPPVRPDSFKAVAENWIKRHVDKKGLRSKLEIERVLTKYVYPHWADRAFTEIRRSDVAALLDVVEDENGSRQADACLTIIRSIGNWYATRHDTYTPPVAKGMRRYVAGARERILSDDELRKIWRQAEANGNFGALVRILLLTAQRRGAVLRMRWQDISDDGVWEIPSEDREKGNAGALRLPEQALAIINAQPRIAGHAFVFAGKSDGPLNGMSRPKARFDKRCGISGWTLHDCRRTARSLMSRAGVRPDIAERVMGHTLQGVEGVYDRHAYFDEKADALAKLAVLIEDIVNGSPSGKIVRLRKAHADA